MSTSDQTTPVILSAGRTPIGRYLGGLAPLSAPKLGALVIREAVRRAGIEATLVEEVIMGNVLQGGVGQAPARQAAIHAGLPGTIPSVTINKVCGSGLKAVMLAAQAIKAGDEQCVVAGGMESMSNAPHYVYGMRGGVKARARVRPGAWAHAPRARHRVRHGRWGAEGPLLRAYRRGPKLDGEGEDADLGLRPDRGQRSVRGAGARRRARPGVGLGPRERKRGRDRVRPPDRRLRRARAHALAVRPQGPAPDDRTRHPLLGRRPRSGPQRGAGLMPVSSPGPGAQPLPLRRAGAIILGAALVAVAAQVSIPLPGTPVPLTLQPLAVLLVCGLLGPARGAASTIPSLALRA